MKGRQKAPFLMMQPFLNKYFPLEEVAAARVRFGPTVLFGKLNSHFVMRPGALVIGPGGLNKSRNSCQER
jgi:hypothetical protein